MFTSRIAPIPARRWPSVMAVLVLTGVVLGPGAPVPWPAGPVVHAQSACDRQCLAGIMTQYLDAMVARDASRLPLAPRVRATENRVEMPPGDGIWKTVTGRRPYRVDMIDVREGVAAVHTVLEEDGAPVLFAARLRVVDRRITEIETMAVRKAVLFAPQNLDRPTATMTYVPTAAERMPREAMVELASRYPAGLRAGSFVTADVPFASGAYRFENGVRMAGPGCTFQPPACENMRTQRIPTLPGVTERLLVVDEEMGVVLYWLDFGPGSLPGPGGGGQALVTFEAFKVYGGQVHAAEAIFDAAPAGAGSGWD